MDEVHSLGVHKNTYIMALQLRILIVYSTVMKFCIVLLLVYQSSRPTASQKLKCSNEFPGICTLNTLTISNASWSEQMQTINITDHPRDVFIKRCVLTNRYSVQSLMEMASKLFADITFQQYHEQTLAITNRLAAESLSVQSAPLLTQLTIFPNQYVRRLYLVNSALRRIPDTIVNLSSLSFLGIDKSYIRLLDLSLLCLLPQLTILQLVNNQIVLLLPALEPSCINSLRDLHLDHNHLIELDLTVLAPFTGLQRLLLQHNRLHSFISSGAISFPLLQTLQLGPGNNLTYIDIELVVLPVPLTIDLPDNELQHWPTLRPDNVPDLQRIYMDGNQLSTLDLAEFREFLQMDGLHFSRNRIRSTTASQYVHLPNLLRLDLAENLLETFTLENCSFPQLSQLSLSRNWFRVVPAVVYTSEVAPLFYLDLQHNPIRCASLQKHLKLISITSFNPRLTVTVMGNCAQMYYNGSIPLTKQNSACCIHAP